MARGRSINPIKRAQRAHHSRLWNRNIVDQPRRPPATEVAWITPFADSDHLRARCFPEDAANRNLARFADMNLQMAAILGFVLGGQYITAALA